MAQLWLLCQMLRPINYYTVLVRVALIVHWASDSVTEPAILGAGDSLSELGAKLPVYTCDSIKIRPIPITL